MTDQTLTNFKDDIKKGIVGESMFKTDFLEFLNINFEDVTESKEYQAIDSDIKSAMGLYEIKTNYKDDDSIIIEEYTNIDLECGPKIYGWFYKSKADMIVFISKRTRTMILIPFTDKFKSHYLEIKENYDLIRNKVSVSEDRQWQSAYRRIPLKSIEGYYSKYRRGNGR